MDIKTFESIAHKLPPEIAILMRGPTGVGKSHLAAAVADKLQLELIDVRGSTMSEGDTGGYPDIEGMKKNGIMTFCMPSWFIRACQDPVVLLLDEVNRSLPGVQQSFFQLVLDRALGNDEDGKPYRLHPETRVMAAVNHGAEYDVNEMDPALLRRFWVVDLKPTHEDWLSWAETAGVDAVTRDFIRNHPVHLRVDPSEVEPGTVCPNPASWHRLDTSLKHMNLVPSDLCGKPCSMIYPIAQGFVGTEAAIEFSTFIEKYELVISGEDIVERCGEFKERLENLPDSVRASTLTSLVDKVVEYTKAIKLGKKQVNNIAAFTKHLNDELLIKYWNDSSAAWAAGTAEDASLMGNVTALHKKIGPRVVKGIKAAQEVSR